MQKGQKNWFIILFGLLNETKKGGKTSKSKFKKGEYRDHRKYRRQDRDP